MNHASPVSSSISQSIWMFCGHVSPHVLFLATNCFLSPVSFSKDPVQPIVFLHHLMVVHTHTHALELRASCTGLEEYGFSEYWLINNQDTLNVSL